MEKDSKPKEKSKILRKIRKVDVECANWFQENGFSDDEDFNELCFEIMSEVVKDKGVNGIKRRCRVWYIIKRYINSSGKESKVKRVSKIKFEDECQPHEAESCQNILEDQSNLVLSSSPAAGGSPPSILPASHSESTQSQNATFSSLPNPISHSAVITDPFEAATVSTALNSSIGPVTTTSVAGKRVSFSADSMEFQKNEEFAHSNGSENLAVGASQFVAPAYPLYVDKDIDAYSQASTMPVELKNRLIRSTISNMVAVAHEKTKRLPSNAELMEMSKSLVLRYKPLNVNEASVSDIFSKLKKRLYNTNSKKTPKKNGDCSDKKRKLSSSNNEDSKDYAKKRSKLTTTNLAGKSEHVVSTSFQQNCNDPHISDDFSNDSSTDESSDDTKVGVYPLIEKKTAGDTNEKEPVDDDNIIERHINALKKEISKKSANLSNIEFYLDKTFDYRRKQLKGLNIDKRIELLDTEYPCFKDCVQIMNELKRIWAFRKQPT